VTRDDDRVARNRATPRRHTPSRTPTGMGMTRRLGVLVAAVTVAATLVLVIALLGRP
jgi:hypothetical protein